MEGVTLEPTSPGLWEQGGDCLVNSLELKPRRPFSGPRGAWLGSGFCLALVVSQDWGSSGIFSLS